MNRTYQDRVKVKSTSAVAWFSHVPGKITRLLFNRPQRREAHEWERRAAATEPELLDDAGLPPHGRKAHHTLPALPVQQP